MPLSRALRLCMRGSLLPRTSENSYSTTFMNKPVAFCIRAGVLAGALHIDGLQDGEAGASIDAPASPMPDSTNSGRSRRPLGAAEGRAAEGGSRYCCEIRVVLSFTWWHADWHEITGRVDAAATDHAAPTRRTL